MRSVTPVVEVGYVDKECSRGKWDLWFLQSRANKKVRGRKSFGSSRYQKARLGKLDSSICEKDRMQVAGLDRPALNSTAVWYLE